LNEPRQAPDPTSDADALEPQIRALFSALDHAGELTEGPAGVGRVIRGEAGREASGTRVRLVLRLVDDRVEAVRYRAYGCPYTLATCEWLARQLEGRPVAHGAEVGSPLEWSERLGLPAAKLGRLLVIEDALRAALAQA
jgi:NifU-like protein involved in Fe-S cluster formation